MSAVSLTIYRDPPLTGANRPELVAARKSVASHRAHPSPLKSEDNKKESPFFIRGVVVSLLLHLVLILAGLAVHLWSDDAVVGKPQDAVLDVSIVPLSALETLLPKGNSGESRELLLPTAESIQQEASSLREAKFERPVMRDTRYDLSTKVVKTAKVSKVVDKPFKSNEISGARAVAQGAAEQVLGVSSGEDVALGQARINYQDMIASLIARAKRYPERALKRGMTGDGSVRIEIAADGSVSNLKIVQSTEAPILDEELRAMVERAGPFPAFPRDLNRAVLAVVVPVSFRIQR